jgi:hypothetical protein
MNHNSVRFREVLGYNGNFDEFVDYSLKKFQISKNSLEVSLKKWGENSEESLFRLFSSCFDSNFH